MKNEIFDKVFDQVIKEASTLYLENEEKKNENVEEVKFSDLHNKKMDKMFKKLKRDENKKAFSKYAKKVAVVVACVMVISGVLISSVEAWRKEFVKFIMKNNDNNYMSIKFCDNCEIESGDITIQSGENENVNSYVTDEIKFLYLPEGFEATKEKDNVKLYYYCFKNEEKYFTMVRENLEEIFIESDIEETSNEKIIFDDKEVFKTLKSNNRITYVWVDEIYLYEVASNIDEKEILKVIENIRILKNF